MFEERMLSQRIHVEVVVICKHFSFLISLLVHKCINVYEKDRIWKFSLSAVYLPEVLF